MRKHILILLSVFVFTISLGGVLHFEHADIIFPEGYEENAKLVGKIFENIRQQVIDLIGNDPGRVTFILQDKGAISNGYTNPLLHKTIVLYLWPPESWFQFSLPLEDWYTYLIIHEFTHMVHLTYQDLFSKIISILTGIPYLPQMNGQFVEGTTVFAESSFSKTSGRLNNPFYADGMYYYSVPNFPSFTYKEIMPVDDFRGGLLYYNFTAGFYKYLVDMYGLDKMKKYLELTSAFLPDLEIGSKYKDVFEKVFGKTFDELYTDWIRSVAKINYNEGELIYRLPNTQIYKIDKTDKGIQILTDKFGPATSYIGTTNSELIELDQSGKEISKQTLFAMDLKIDSDTKYALIKSETMGTYENQVWDLSANRIIAKGNISAFAIADKKLYLANYDSRTMKTKIVGDDFELTLDKYVSYMDGRDTKLALLLSDYSILIVDTKTKETFEINDDAMKGPYIRFWKDGILFTRVDGKYVNPYYYDLSKRKLYRLGENMLVYDFCVINDFIYYVSYIPYTVNTGMGIYKIKYSQSEAELKVYKYDFNFADVKFEYGSEISFRINKFMQPLTWIPMYEHNETDDIHRGYMIFTFGNIENDTFVVLTPIFDLKITDSSFNLSYSQYISAIQSKDSYELFVSYYYPTNDYNLTGAFRFGTLKLTPNTNMYGYLTFSFKSEYSYIFDTYFNLFATFNVPSVYSKNIGFGLLVTSNLLSLPYKAQAFLLLSSRTYEELFSYEKLLSNLYAFSYFGIALNLDTTFESQATVRLEDIQTVSYDVSLAYTLFKDSSFIFGNLIYIRNSGITIGISNPVALSNESIHGLYTHFFIETYVSGLKLYPVAGIFSPFTEILSEEPLYLIYFGLNSSPHGLPLSPWVIPSR